MIKKILCWVHFHGESKYLGRGKELRNYSFGQYWIHFHKYRCNHCKKEYRTIHETEAIINPIKK